MKAHIHTYVYTIIVSNENNQMHNEQTDGYWCHKLYSIHITMWFQKYWCFDMKKGRVDGPHKQFWHQKVGTSCFSHERIPKRAWGGGWWLLLCIFVCVREMNRCVKADTTDGSVQPARGSWESKRDPASACELLFVYHLHPFARASHWFHLCLCLQRLLDAAACK